jgi:hypothetical protein
MICVGLILFLLYPYPSPFGEAAAKMLDLILVQRCFTLFMCGLLHAKFRIIVWFAADIML